ncbi:uncharacterized protein [Macrobrachium rosenbergii]|uniref:uncharacterized protein n=1 Tax=Macrobrachium rosenbergii TaxID=79674 RepID=UPI0034D6ABD6
MGPKKVKSGSESKKVKSDGEKRVQRKITIEIKKEIIEKFERGVRVTDIANTKDIITLNLPHGDSSVDFAAMVKICLGISLFFTYPMMMFPVTHLLDKTLGFTAVPYKGNIMRLVLVGVTGLVVSAVPNFAILMGLIGATCCTLLAFILPAAFHMSIFKQRLTKRQWYFDAMLIFLGISGSIIGVWDAFNRMNGHDQVVELNEFSPVKFKNSTVQNELLLSKPATILKNISTTVHTAIAQTEANYNITLKPTIKTVVNPTEKQASSVVSKEMAVVQPNSVVTNAHKVLPTYSSLQSNTGEPSISNSVSSSTGVKSMGEKEAVQIESSKVSKIDEGLTLDKEKLNVRTVSSTEKSNT